VKYDADWLRRRYGTINPVVNFPPNYNGAPTEPCGFEAALRQAWRDWLARAGRV
jgi:hypothetical protein